MRSPSAPEVLDAWERGLARPLIERALELLRVSRAAPYLDEIPNATIGQRDAELLALREKLFGTKMAAVVACPQCEAELDLDLDAARMRSAGLEPPKGELSIRANGYEVTFRAPQCADLLWLEGADEEENWRRLFERCVVSVKGEDGEPRCAQLPDDVVEAVSEQMAKADPLADIRLRLCCPVCQHHWQAVFDIVSFLWREIESFSKLMLRDVHTLAWAYGWREEEILSLSAVRRQFYLGLVNG